MRLVTHSPHWTKDKPHETDGTDDKKGLTSEKFHPDVLRFASTAEVEIFPPAGVGHRQREKTDELPINGKG